MFDRGWRRTEAAPVPVVSVGNLTAGGTGKTPCVELVARFYRDLDRRVAILSRGYGAAAGMNDEALVLEQNLPDVPHLQGADRAALARVAVEELESEVLILDDGFRRTLERLGLDVVAWRTFPDHHAYTREDVDELRRWAREQPAEATLVTTQKDLVKIKLDRLGERALWALRIRLAATANEEAL